MDPAERLARFERALEALIESAYEAPILVEGTRDAEALRELGVTGEIIVYNRGQSMAVLADRLRRLKRLIVMFDWDRKGGQLTHLLKDHLSGGRSLDLELRKEFASVSLVRCVEDLTHARRTLRKRAEEAVEDA